MSVKLLPVFALLAAWPPAAVAADDFPKRQTGLWVPTGWFVIVIIRTFGSDADL